MESQASLMPEVESSRTHFEVLGLGLEASSPRKLPCSRLEDSTIFLTVEVLLENARNLGENLRTPFCFPHLEHRLRQGGGGQWAHPPIEISPMTKSDKKAYFVSSVSVSF